MDGSIAVVCPMCGSNIGVKKDFQSYYEGYKCRYCNRLIYFSEDGSVEIKHNHKIKTSSGRRFM